MANTKLPARLLDTSAIPALNVTGDLTVDTTTLKVDSTNNRVGIGTASPGTPLTISNLDNGTSFSSNRVLQLIGTSTTDGSRVSLAFTGNTSIGNGLAIIEAVNDDQSEGHTSLHMHTYNGSWNTENLVLKGGNVGIGTSSPSADLHIGKTSGAAVLKVDTTATADAGIQIKGYDAYVALGDNTNGLQWYVWNDGPSSSSSLKFGSQALSASDWYADASQAMVITSSGNVGIGTNNPTEKLHIGGTAPGDSIIRQDATSSGTNWEIGERVAGKYQFWEDDGDNVRLTIMSTGNIGIGTDTPNQWASYTDNGATVLQVQDTSQRARMVINGGDGAHLDLVDYAGGTNDKHLNFAVDGGIGKFGSLNDAGNAFVQNNIMVMDLGTGNVGIGTDSPAQTLSVDASGGANLFVGRTGQTGGLYIESDGTNGVVRNPANSPLLFQTNGANTRMRILGDGRVGINRTPAIANSKLEVGGADNVPLINVEASGATAGVGIGNSRMKFYYGTSEKMSLDSVGNLRTSRQIIQENSDGTPRFINIPYSSAGSGFTFNWDDLANHSAVGDQASETNAFMFEVNVTSYLFRRVKALIIVDTNSTNSIAVHTIHSNTLTCSASIPTGSEQITITIGGLWGNAVNYMGRITTF